MNRLPPTLLQPGCSSRSLRTTAGKIALDTLWNVPDIDPAVAGLEPVERGFKRARRFWPGRCRCPGFQP
jgi:hypothetical protein